MTVFEDLIVELKEENLLEETVDHVELCAVLQGLHLAVHQFDGDRLLLLAQSLEETYFLKSVLWWR